MCIKERKDKEGAGDHVKGHLSRRNTEFTQNTVFKGQGFEGLVRFALKKKN